MTNFAFPHYLVNGKHDACITPDDRGLAYGDGVFRTLKAVQGTPVNWSLHYRKLESDCARLHIKCPASGLLLEDISKLKLTEAAVIKIVITRGQGQRGYAIPADISPTRIVMTTALPVYPAGYDAAGVKVYVCETKLGHQPLLAGIKHLNRLENVLARMEWKDTAFAEGLVLDIKGRVIEGISSNIFARYGKDVITPDLSNCGVAGVTRQQILELLPDLGMRPKVSHMTLNKLLQADEIFLCNSIYGVWQVTAMADSIWEPQPLASQLKKQL